MRIDFSADVITALANFVVVLEEHPLGGVVLIMLILAVRASVTSAKRDWK